MKFSSRILALSVAFAFSTLASAQTLTGTVKNGTNGKPAAGDAVVLLRLAQGMEEAGRTTTDNKGSFSFKLDDAGGPHLVRAIHQGVTYHHMAPPGTSSVEMEVFDVAKKVEGVSVTADVMRFQAPGNQLQATRVFAVNNSSSPPRTQMNDSNFEFYLPEGAQIMGASATTAGGQPLSTSPVPQKEKNRYAFIFPLRPGQTLFQLEFALPYSGEASIDPKALYPAQHFVVMLPATMQFSASPGSGFESKPNPREPSATVQVASNTQLGQSLAFKISGSGLLAEAQEGGGGGGGESGGAAAGRDSRPGGGLGPPIDAPDPLENYRWYILGGFAVVLAAGAVYIAKRSKVAAVPDFAAADMQVAAIPPVAKPTTAGRPGLLLEALKEEMFELEVEHKQGRISQQEYQKAKSALDQTLERALKRQSARAT